MPIILHLTTRTAWDQAKAAGAYQGDTLATEGFIHCSTARQITRTANKFYAGKPDLVVLLIDQDKVGPEVRYEDLNAGDMFPHIYGPLNVDAVTGVVAVPQFAKGEFAPPPEVARLMV